MLYIVACLFKVLDTFDKLTSMTTSHFFYQLKVPWMHELLLQLQFAVLHIAEGYPQPSLCYLFYLHDTFADYSSNLIFDRNVTVY